MPTSNIEVQNFQLTNIFIYLFYFFFGNSMMMCSLLMMMVAATVFLLLYLADVRGITNRKTVLEGYENVQAALLDYTLTCYPSVEVSVGE